MFTANTQAMTVKSPGIANIVDLRKRMPFVESRLLPANVGYALNTG